MLMLHKYYGYALVLYRESADKDKCFLTTNIYIYMYILFSQKVKKEPDKDSNNVNDITKGEAQKAKSSKQEQVTPPTQAKRVTRTSLKKHPDKATKKSKEQASSENAEGRNVEKIGKTVQRKSKQKISSTKVEETADGSAAKTAEASVIISKVRSGVKRSSRNGKGKTEGDVAKVDKAGVVSKVRKRATRTSS